MNYVLISVASVHTGNKFFTYSSAIDLSIGEVVNVAYTKNNVYGIVIDVVKKPTFKTKQVLKTTGYIIPKNYLLLLKWMYDYYPDDYGSITSLFIPPNAGVSLRQTKTKVFSGKNLPLPKATKDQQQALLAIKKHNLNKILLHGDTGTGKTRVFTELIKETLADNKSVIVLTPEIGLTPQLIADIANHIKNDVIVSHSKLGPAERKRIWLKAYNSAEPTVYLGPRSALFLPIKNLGLIVIDEAHDSSFYQQQSPRYGSLYVAGKLAAVSKARYVISTATPNVNDYYIAIKKGFSVLRLTQLAVKDSPATGQIIDLTNKELFIESHIIADALIKAVRESLDKGEQSMLFLNRRGSARLVQCSNCGWQALCKKCGLPLTYHQDMHSLICHTCNNKKPAPTKCSKCDNTDLVYKSPGTKAVAEHLQNLFPKNNIARFDADSSGEDQYYKNIDKLKNGQIDIIIGTQLITKGIDITGLSVVGVINADSSLNLPDYSAEEHTFQQLYQVTGRVGRGHRLSKFFIQSRLPEHPVIQSALSRNWTDFYNSELHKRKLFSYPPFSYLAVAKIAKKTASSASKNAQQIANKLALVKSIEVLGPALGYYEHKDGKYTWQIVLKSKKRSELVSVLRNLPSDWSVWIDAQSLL